MKRTLGLDLGSNSLGWAILDDMTGDILDKGVVVFPAGIDAANDTLETHARVLRVGHGIGRFHVEGYVSVELAAEADVFCVARKGTD